MKKIIIMLDAVIKTDVYTKRHDIKTRQRFSVTFRPLGFLLVTLLCSRMSRNRLDQSEC